MPEAIQNIPKHLHKYIVEQNYDRYTFEDQEVWRFIMRQLKSFLALHAHEVYLEGLIKTGIQVNQIPEIKTMDSKLQEFGWRAVPVSGFIPPAAFMEFQAYGILPIASDMRSVEHILYTPAPDIVHEAAGHAPILIDPAFSSYLKSYAEVASKSIISSEDIQLYKAIRDLSDIKEAPGSTKEEIKNSEENLKKATESMSFISEAQLLGRMNWWTAEYGLIGELENPKIFGAGLLSSISEARKALKKPKKIPLSIDCLDYSYDITEPQPQLFVAKDFKELKDVLNKMSESLAYKVGGYEALNKALESKSVCSVHLSNGASYSALITAFDFNEKLFELKLSGPVQYCENKEFVELKNDKELKLNFKEGIEVVSVHGGPVHSKHFPELVDFIAAKIPPRKLSGDDLKKFEAYGEIRNLRSNFKNDSFLKLIELYCTEFKSQWLMGISLIELASLNNLEIQKNELMNHLSQAKVNTEDEKICVDLGLSLLKAEGLLS